jgi:hypothetical protein
MQDYQPSTRVGKNHLRILNKRYARTDEPWLHYYHSKRSTKPEHLEIIDKLRIILDQSRTNPTHDISLKEILITIGCPEPWHNSNEKYLYILYKLNLFQMHRYLITRPEQLIATDQSQIIPYQRSPRRKIQSDTWHLFS